MMQRQKLTQQQVRDLSIILIVYVLFALSPFIPRMLGVDFYKLGLATRQYCEQRGWMSVQ